MNTSKTPFYLTTPIYYSNWVPHIWHAYSSFLADTIASYKKYSWYDVRFTTGVDENSQKIVESAQSAWKSLEVYTNEMAAIHKNIWDSIGINYTNFVRTTSDSHRVFVQEVLQKTYDAWDIYLGEYHGLYCVWCEAYKKEKDLIDGKCPDHPNKEIEHIEEKNYFFRLSKYQDALLEFYKNNPDWIVPRSRYNEIIEFVKDWLEDFSISRETNTFGIPLPFDTSHVTYVWFDALYSYMSTLGDELDIFWPADLHIIGKDIIKFHWIYWPAMLMSAGYPLPKNILTTGHFTVDWQKMSKTIGNVIDPVAYSETYSRDALLLYLFSAFPIGEDGDFDNKQALVVYNAKLSNNLWNLLSRVITLSLKLWGNIATSHTDSIESYEWYVHDMNRYALKDALEGIFEYASNINKYIDETAPWKLDIETDKASLENILATCLVHLRRTAIMLIPFFGEKMESLLVSIGTPYDTSLTLKENLEIIPNVFSIPTKPNSLYPRYDVK